MKKILSLLTLGAFVFLFASCVTTSKPEQSLKEDSKNVSTPTKSNLDDEEYKRSIKDIDGAKVSHDKFASDKKDILSIIQELNVIMKKRNYTDWLEYVDPESIAYWSNKRNLNRVASQLPVKNLKLNTAEDYFNYVFIPSRVGKNIDEIRYLSADSIKAIQIRNEESIIYYNFKKPENRWLVVLPRL